jgi:hypothetical protein
MVTVHFLEGEEFILTCHFDHDVHLSPGDSIALEHMRGLDSVLRFGMYRVLEIHRGFTRYDDKARLRVEVSVVREPPTTEA